MRSELLKPSVISVDRRSNFCPDHASGGAPYLARFSRDVGYHGPRLTAPGFVAEPDGDVFPPTLRSPRRTSRSC
jgi:hypothetical protein